MNCLVFPSYCSRATRLPRPLVGPKTHVLKPASQDPQPRTHRLGSRELSWGKNLMRTADSLALPPVATRPPGALLQTIGPKVASPKPTAQPHATRPALENAAELLHQVIAARTLVLELFGSVGALTCALVERL